MIESQEQDSIEKTTDDEALPDEENMSLSEDTYGMLLILSPKSSQFWKTFAVAVFQVTLIVMISINLYEREIGDPLFKPPTGISIQVFVGQIMALIIGVMAQNDITESIELLVYSPAELASDLKVSPLQVLIINLIHFSVGIGGLFIVFLVVVQSNDIVGLFADFAAMEFISHIDELFFHLASLSYVGRDLCIATEELKNIKIPSSIQGRSAKKILLYFPMIITFAGWGWVQWKMLTGKDLDPFFTVFIPDDFNVNDSYLSGVYASTKCKHKRRFSYVNDKIVKYDEDENVSVRGVISYCSESETWVLNSYFTATKVENVCFELENNEIYDPCKRILLQSPRTKEYSINEISPREWSMKSSEGGFVPVPSFFNYVSNECQEDRDCSVLRNDKYGGTCNKDTNTCACTGGRFGKSCEYSKPCAIQHETYFSLKEKQYYKEDSEYVSIILNKIEDETEPFLFNDHPVYYQAFGELGALVLYQGVRFIQHFMDLNELDLTDVDVDSLNYIFVEYLSNDTIDILESTWISEQTDAGSPDGLEWFDIITDAGKVTKTKGGGFGKLGRVEQKFICPECSLVGNRCGNGQCNNGTCVCEEGYDGSLCQISLTEAPTSPPTLNLNVTGIPN